jgi:surface antigen
VSPTKQDDETAKDSMTPDYLKGIDITPEEEKSMEDAAYSGAADDIAEREGLSGTDLKAAEENPGSPSGGVSADSQESQKVGLGYRDEGGKNKKKVSGSFLSRNKKLFLGGGVGAGLAGILLSLLLLLPLKVHHVVNNLQNRFFATSEQATSDMTDRLLRAYVVNKVMPGMIDGKCRDTKVTRSCAKVSPGDGLVKTLYSAWKDANFENKLATKHGVVIERYGGNNFRLITPSTLAEGGIDLKDFDPNNPGNMDQKLFKAMDRSSVRREVRKAFESETFSKRVMYRYKVGKLLERKYGVVRCLVACNLRDDVKSKTEAKKLAWKGYFVDRIIEPRNEMMAIAVRCAIGGFSCTNADEIDEDGRNISEFERETREMIASRNIGEKDLEQLNRDSEEIRKKGFTEHLLAKLMGPIAAKASIKAIPIVGVSLFDAAGKAGPAAKKLNYIINSQTMVTMWMMYRTNADEIKAGDMDAAMMGSVVESLGPNAGTDQNGGGAESSPYYKEVMATGSKNTASIFSAFIPTAKAAEAYPCNNGDTVTSGVCPELMLSTTRGMTQVAGGLSAVLNSPLFTQAQITAAVWGYTGGAAIDLLENILGGVLGIFGDGLMALIKNAPGGQAALDAVEKVGTAISKWFIGWFINNPVGDSPSGGRNFDIAAGGADFAGNDFCHYGLGCQKTTVAAAKEIRLAQEKEAQESFLSQPLLARMFDTSSKYSLVSRAAMALPSTTLNGNSQSFVSTLVSPFSSLATSTFGIGNRGVASAANEDEDPFGITQYAYSKDDRVLNDDPEVYWDREDCGNPEKVKKWGEQSTVDEDTGMPEHNITNGCKLLEASVGMAGGIYTDAVLTAADLNGSDGSETPTNEAGSFTVASYNILHSTSHTDTSRQIGGCDSNPVPGDPTCAKTRAANQVQIITGKTGNPAFDIFGTQETSPEQYRILKDMLPNYAAFPEGTSRMNNQDDGAVAVFWDTTKFSMFTSGKAAGISNTARKITNPWVGLQTKSGQKIYVMSIHYAQNACSDGDCGNSTPQSIDDENMRKSSELTMDWVKSKSAEDATVIVVGDFNDTLRQKLSYCIYTRDSIMQHAVDMDAGASINAGCKNNRFGGIDHIYATPKTGFTASNWTHMADKGIVARGSDHTPVYVTYSFAGTASAGTAQMKDDYASECGKYGVCGGQCVDFVKFRLLKHGTRYKGGPLGNGADVARNLGTRYGYKVDNKPAVNAVVSWPAGGVPGSGANSQYGHTAMVSRINSDGSIVVEEYNYAIPLGYGVRKIPASAVKLLTYAHTEVDYR